MIGLVQNMPGAGSMASSEKTLIIGDMYDGHLLLLWPASVSRSLAKIERLIRQYRKVWVPSRPKGANHWAAECKE